MNLLKSFDVFSLGKHSTIQVSFSNSNKLESFQFPIQLSPSTLGDALMLRCEEPGDMPTAGLGFGAAASGTLNLLNCLTVQLRSVIEALKLITVSSYGWAWERIKMKRHPMSVLQWKASTAFPLINLLGTHHMAPSTTSSTFWPLTLRQGADTLI